MKRRFNSFSESGKYETDSYGLVTKKHFKKRRLGLSLAITGEERLFSE